MIDFQQIMNGGAGAAGFYVLYLGVTLVKNAMDKHPKGDKSVCEQHGVLIAHFETIKEDICSIKGDVKQLIRDVALIQGRENK